MTATILNHLWQSSVFAVAIWALNLLFRNNGASIRHGLWLVASVKFLLPFSLLAALGGMAFTHTVTAGSMQALARIEPAALPFVAARPVLAASAPNHLSWMLVAAAIWGLGFLAILLFWLVRAARLAAIVRAGVPLAIDAPVPVRATPALLEPGLAGILRPVILLPESLSQNLSKTEIDAILAHELCHLSRRDNLAAAAHMLVEAVFWFHPLVWFIGARLVEEREQACDEDVLNDGKQPLDYAQAILKVCRHYFRSPLPCASGVSGADLDRRITAIMLRRDVDDVDPHKILLLAGLGAIAVMTPLVIGGLKQASPAPLVQSLVQTLVPAELVPHPVLIMAPSQHKRVLPSNPAPRPVQRLVAAPDLDTSLPIFILALPQLESQIRPKSPIAASAADAIVCRPPQQLPDSRLRGPEVCLPMMKWDRLRAHGQHLMPDGKTVAAGYDETRLLRPMTCRSVGTNTSAATNWYVDCHQ